MEGNETLAALRKWLLLDPEVAGRVEDRIYQPKLPEGLADWPAIYLTDLPAALNINVSGWREDMVQIVIYGNPQGTDIPDHSQLVRTIAHYAAQRLGRHGGIAAVEPRIMAVSGVQVVPDWDEETKQPMQRVLATVQVAELREAVV